MTKYSMKKALITACKAILFFLGWVLCVGVIDIPSENPVVWRFWAEFIPMAAIILFSAVFWLIEKRQMVVAPVEKPLKSTLFGTAVGALWLGAAVLVLYLMGVIKFTGRNDVDSLWLWIVSCFLNVVMQELLVRGYLYQLIKKNYSIVTATVITTALFTLLHGGAFEAGIIPVLNVITMSVFMTLALEFTHSILTPIMIHFIWNAVGSIILGSSSLADDYPMLLNTTYSGSELLTGGSCKIEGSIVVFVLNIILIALFTLLIRNRSRTKKS